MQAGPFDECDRYHGCAEYRGHKRPVPRARLPKGMEVRGYIRHHTMDIRFAHSLFQAMRRDRIAFGYSGAFHDEHTARLITLGEASVEGFEKKGVTRGKLAFVMVEAYQNIIRHRAQLQHEVEHGEGRSMFLLRCQNEGQQVAAINAVRKTDVPGLHDVLKRLQGLDRNELKELFLSSLQSESNASRRGAGLGLIEMARRSGSELGYLLRGLGAEHELFVLVVKLGEAVAYEQLIKELAILHGSVVMNDILMFHLGTCSAATNEALLRLVEKDMDERTDRAELRGRAYLAAMDAVRSADPDAKGVRLIARAGDRYILITGTVMPEEEAVRLGKQVDLIASWDEFTLQRHYRDALLKRGDDHVSFGLIELTRTAAEPISFTHLPVEGGRLALVRAVI